MNTRDITKYEKKKCNRVHRVLEDSTYLALIISDR
jgi:hypothetical protein